MKTKLSLLALISAAVLPCNTAWAEEYNVIIYDEGEVPQSETTDLNAAIDYINGADGDIAELWANMELSSALDIDLDSEFYLRSDGTTKRLISGKEMYRHIDFSADELTIYCTNIVFASGCQEKTVSVTRSFINQSKESERYFSSFSGGSLYARNSGTISLGGNADFVSNDLSLAHDIRETFAVNYFSATASGGAICAGKLNILKNATMSFSENMLENKLYLNAPNGVNDTMPTAVCKSIELNSFGGAVCGDTSILSGATVSFARNMASFCVDPNGLEFCFGWDSEKFIHGGMPTKFSVAGGAVCGSVITQKNVRLDFSQNTSKFDGGYLGSPRPIGTFYVETTGGAIDGETIQFGELSEVTFSENIATASGFSAYDKTGIHAYMSVSGGAISAESVEFSKSVKASFFNNRADVKGYLFERVTACGGAVSGAVKIGENAEIVFSQNSVSLEGVSIRSGGQMIPGGGAISGTLVVSPGARVKFIGNSAGGRDARGGAVYSSAIQLSGALEFEENSVASTNAPANVFGGAIYISGRVDFESALTSVIFSKNTASSGLGGAIYAGGKASSIAFSDAFSGSAEFSSNSAGSGGAIYAQGSLVLSGLGGTICFNNNEASRQGGAVYAEGQFSSTNHAEASFSGNKAGDKGGAIYAALSTEDLYGRLTFMGNNAVYGGGIYGAKALAFRNGSNLTFRANEAISGSGGAIYGVGQVAIGENTTLDFSGNKAGVSGGAIYSEANVGFSGSGSFSGNSAKASGGAIYATTKVRMAPKTDVEFSANSAKDGGAIYAGTVADIVARSVRFVGNTATNFGGAIYVSGGSADFSGTANASFSKNSALNGGAIYAVSNFRNGTTSTFSENTASNLGGAIAGVTAIDAGATVTFSGNKAATGGAINGTTTIYGNVEFSGNTAASATSNVFGGAISGTTVTMDASEATQTKFIGNKIVSESGDYNFRGGAISASNVNLKGGSILFQGNSASGVGSSSIESGGGAIYAANRVVFESDASVIFKGNTVLNDATQTFGGGAIYGNFITLAGTLNFENNSVINTRSGRSEWYSAGGAVFSFGGLTVSKDTNAIFAGNSAAYGGAIDAYKGDLTFAEGAKVRFSGNSAAQGGAIYVDAGTFTLAGDVAFADNTATTYGGAIRIAGTTLRGMGDTTQVVFSGNKVGTDSKGWKNNDIYMTNAKGVVALQDAGTYTFGGGIDGSKGGSLTIGLDAGGNVAGGTRVAFKAGAVNTVAGDVTIAGSGTTVRFGNADNAFSGDVVVKSAASVVLERGAVFDILSGGSLAVSSNAEFLVRTDLTGATVINVAEGASVTFDNTAKLVIDLSTAMPATRNAGLTSGEAAQIAIICASADATIGEISNIEVRVDGSVFTGDWSLSRENNTLYLVASIPEPSAFGLLAGLGALALVSTRRRREGTN